MAITRNVPGPGTHEDVTRMHPKGQYVSSQLSNSKAAYWSKDVRLKNNTSKFNKSPGPGAHETVSMTECCKPSQMCSNYHNILTKKFGPPKPTISRIERFATPGPANYRLPSDFGYMD